MLRKNKGMSQLELAKNITTRRSIGEVEHGYKDLPYTTMIKIIQRLGISLSNFEEYRQGAPIFCRSGTDK
ncbi:helix-turn-helix domain-containing protein [Lactiplantibacillus plantarum]|uniref:helix-turn-helix domain-containing protein n=1 Tax=Lactiplantibacillus plantarum TaxID=1590 RepID=UPI003982ACB2